MSESAATFTNAPPLRRRSSDSSSQSLSRKLIEVLGMPFTIGDSDQSARTAYVATNVLVLSPQVPPTEAERESQRRYLEWVAAQAEAFENEAITISEAEFDRIYHDSYFEAMEPQNKRP